jgi:Histidine kinase-, DNA gyrase B-, and HSP90-like ATPase
MRVTSGMAKKGAKEKKPMRRAPAQASARRTNLPEPVPETQGSLFEENFLVRSAGQVGSKPDVALTELVANAWDAGASTVDIIIPSEPNELLIVRDNGAGLTAEDFRTRWMTLGYNREKHQGPYADQLAKGTSRARRRAFGRNGIGRHGMLCFNDEYEVETRRDGTLVHFRVRATEGDDPFVCERISTRQSSGHGTTLRVHVRRNLPNASRIRDVISARFLQDPQFRISVNGEHLDLTEFPGLLKQTTLAVGDGVFEVLFIDGSTASRRMYHHGIAFWVNGRLVGEPGWYVGKDTLLDGRTREAKRLAVIVKADFLDTHITPDWTGFRPSEQLDEILAVVSEHIRGLLTEVLAEHVKETQEQVVRDHADELRTLSFSERAEVGVIIKKLGEHSPTMRGDDLSAVMSAVIELQRTRSGKALIDKLVAMSESDLDTLDAILNEWTVQDARTVLDEIDRRLSVIAAIEKLCGDPTTDELHTLHPLVTQARWLFGPECDSPTYAANMSLRKALVKVLGDGVDISVIPNPSRRADLLVLQDSTFSAVATEDFDAQGSVMSKLRRVLLIELKRGDSTIKRDAMSQADGYVQDIVASGHLDGPPFVQAFVVGHRIDATLQRVKQLGENPVIARIEAVTYDQLVRTANARMFRLREHIAARYDKAEPTDLIARVLAEPWQTTLTLPGSDARRNKTSG